MSNSNIKPLSLAIGTGLVGAFAFAHIAQAGPVFQLTTLAAGYAQTAGDHEGKCGEGKCGEGKCGTVNNVKCHDLNDKAAQDKCIADAQAAKGKEGACSKDMHKGKQGTANADKKGKEGACSSDMKKGKEGGCGSHR
ncbi:MAG: hypothetical protein JSR65_06050 [Proteobacteria bacterium]|nr:hypothetical protein [Pseudomonadota bacterium]